MWSRYEYPTAAKRKAGAAARPAPDPSKRFSAAASPRRTLSESLGPLPNLEQTQKPLLPISDLAALLSMRDAINRGAPSLLRLVRGGR